MIYGWLQEQGSPAYKHYIYMVIAVGVKDKT